MFETHQKRMLHMYGNIPYMFDHWDDPVVHLLLLKTPKLQKKRLESRAVIFFEMVLGNLGILHLHALKYMFTVSTVCTKVPL